MSIKLGFLGLAGSGKDTAAEILQRVLAEQGMCFPIMKYAGLLKEATRLAFGDNFDDRDVKEERVFVTPDLADKLIDATDYIWVKLWGNNTYYMLKYFDVYNDLCQKHIDSKTWISPREFQQLLGTDVVRTIDPDAWVNYLKGQDGNFIITDCRFGNEGTDFNILMMRQDAPDTSTVHESEKFAISCMLDIVHGNPEGYYHDYTLWNKGTLEELERNIRFMVTTIDFSNYR